MKINYLLRLCNTKNDQIVLLEKNDDVEFVPFSDMQIICNTIQMDVTHVEYDINTRTIYCNLFSNIFPEGRGYNTINFDKVIEIFEKDGWIKLKKECEIKNKEEK